MAVSSPPLTGKEKLGWGLTALAAFLGRNIITAYYGRAVQAATDPYIKYVGGTMLASLLSLLLNFALVMMGAHGFQTALAILLPFVALFYSFTPAIGGPLSLVAGGPKNLFRMMALVLWWVEVYILITMLAPFHLYPVLFWMLHIPIIGAILLLMNGHVPIDSEKVYTWCFRITIGTLVAGVLAVFAFRENLGPLWAQFSANKTSQAEALLDSTSIKNADGSAADWIAKNVKVGPHGDQVVIVKDRVTGELKAVPAQPYIEREMKRRDDVIRSVTGKAAAGSATSSTGVAVAYKPIWWKDFPGWVKYEWEHERMFLIILLLAHFIPVWMWKKRKTLFGTAEEKAAAKKAEVATSSSDVSISTIVILILLCVAGYYWYQYETDTAGTSASFKPLPNITVDDSLKYEVLFTDLIGTFPQKPISTGKFEGYLVEGSYATSTVSIVVSFGFEGKYDLAMKGNCIPGRNHVPRTCSGNYDAGYGRAGVFRADWGPQGDTLWVKLYDSNSGWEAAKLPHHAEMLFRQKSTYK